MLVQKWLLKMAVVAILVAQPAQAANLKEGRTLYGQQCAICHGQNGVSTMPGAPNFKFGNAMFKSDQMLVEHLKNGRNACPSFLGLLREREMYDVVAYLRSFYP